MPRRVTHGRLPHSSLTRPQSLLATRTIFGHSRGVARPGILCGSYQATHGFTRVVAQRPLPSMRRSGLIYATNSQSGVFVSANNGTSWTQLSGAGTQISAAPGLVALVGTDAHAYIYG